MKQNLETVTRIPTHPVVASAITAYDKLRQWADGMLVGHTDFNKVFYDILQLLGKIKAGTETEAVEKLTEVIAIELCEHVEFFENQPFNVSTYAELRALGVELIELRADLKHATTTSTDIVPLDNAPVVQQNLDPILQAVTSIGNKLDLVLLQQLERITPEPSHKIEDSKKVELQKCTETLLKYREWLESTYEFEANMRDMLDDHKELQEGFRCNVPDIADQSADIVAIDEVLNGLMQTRKPVQEAVFELERYITAWKIVNHNIPEKYLEVELPKVNGEIVVSSVSDVHKTDEVTATKSQLPLKEGPLKDRNNLNVLGFYTKSSSAEVFFVSLFDLIPSSSKGKAGYKKMMRLAIQSGLAQKYGWNTEADLRNDYEKSSTKSFARSELLRFNGVANGSSVILSRSSITLPWRISDVFSEEEIEHFKQLLLIK